MEGAGFRLSLRGCRLEEEGRARRLVGPNGEQSLDGSPARLAVARWLLDAEGAGGVTEADLAARVVAQGGYAWVRELYRLLFELHGERWLWREVRHGERLLASCLPLVAECPFSAPPLGEGSFVLSRFAYLRRRGEGLVIESPRSLARVLVHDARVAALVARLARPATLDRLRQETLLGLDDGVLAELCELLSYAGCLTRIESAASSGDAGLCEEERGALGPWQFHDLLFHARSRAGRSDTPYGGTFRLRGTIEPLPALKGRMKGPTIELPRPDLSALAAGDPPLNRVLEGRRSRRDHGEPAITLKELAALLYRTARAGPVESAARTGRPYDVARRIYPGGGGAWELELYPVINRCRGLVPGLYHYRPGEHQLTRLSDRTREVERLLAGAGKAAQVEQVQVLLVVGARFGRLFWKYSSMAYATVLKDVGVLYQTIYLAATAMDLAVCALGGGNADLFARATGLDYYEEGSVGELILGRPAAEEPLTPRAL